MTTSTPAFNAAVSEKRKEKDVVKLLMSDYKVTPSLTNPCDFTVLFKGPKESPYETGEWSVHVLLPEQYPYKSPSIGFDNKIFHPNIDFLSGTVCLDVINQTWSPMFDLINIFDVFLPQLLLYPNPSSPLNPEAASLMMKDLNKYNEKVVENVRKYAQSTMNLNDTKKCGEETKKVEDGSGKMELESDSLDEELSEISGLSETSELSVTSEIELLEN